MSVVVFIRLTHAGQWIGYMGKITVKTIPCIASRSAAVAVFFLYGLYCGESLLEAICCIAAAVTGGFTVHA